MRLPHLLHAERPAAAASSADTRTDLGPAQTDGAGAPSYVWPLNPWGGFPFRPARG